MITCEDIFGREDLKGLRETAKEYYITNLANVEVYNEDVGAIRFTKVGRREFFHYSANRNKIIIIPYLREIVKTAKLADFKGLEHPRRDKMKGFYYLTSSILLDNKITNIEVVVSIDEYGNRLFYDIFFETREERIKNKKTHKTDS
jgi:hypothetical protein